MKEYILKIFKTEGMKYLIVLIIGWIFAFGTQVLSGFIDFVQYHKVNAELDNKQEKRIINNEKAIKERVTYTEAQEQFNSFHTYIESNNSVIKELNENTIKSNNKLEHISGIVEGLRLRAKLGDLSVEFPDTNQDINALN